MSCKQDFPVVAKLSQPLLKEKKRYSNGKQTSSSVSPSHYLDELQQQRRCFFPLGLFNSTDYNSYFLARYSAAIKHFDKKQCSTTHEYLSLPSLDSVLEEEISVTDWDGFFCFYGQFITMRYSKKWKQWTSTYINSTENQPGDRMSREASMCFDISG